MQLYINEYLDCGDKQIPNRNTCGNSNEKLNIRMFLPFEIADIFFSFKATHPWQNLSPLHWLNYCWKSVEPYQMSEYPLQAVWFMVLSKDLLFLRIQFFTTKNIWLLLLIRHFSAVFVGRNVVHFAVIATKVGSFEGDYIFCKNWKKLTHTHAYTQKTSPESTKIKKIQRTATIKRFNLT